MPEKNYGIVLAADIKDQLAQLLGEKGIKLDTIVEIMAERSIEMVTGIFGKLKAGGAIYLSH